MKLLSGPKYVTFASLRTKLPILVKVDDTLRYITQISIPVQYVYYFEKGVTAYINVTGKEKVLVVEDEALQHEAKINHLPLTLGHACTIGSDPEIFVVDKNQRVIPAFEFLGSKENPNRITYNNAKLFWDGFQAEFTTRGGGCLAQCVDDINYGLTLLLQKAKAYNKDATLTIVNSLEVGYDQLMNAKEEEVAFGCSPSLNVYGLKGITAPGREVAFRSAGGHIHFGFYDRIKETPEGAARVERMVKALDAILGVACVSLFAGYDNPKRREYYGMAGEYRLPAHGLEYRVLSNAWMIHPVLMHIVFDLARKAMVFGDKNFMSYWTTPQEESVRVIQTCDVTAARGILKANENLFSKIVQASYNGNENAHKLAMKAFTEGLDSIIKNPTDIEGNWNLTGKTAWVGHSEGVDKNCGKAGHTVAAGKKLA